MRDRSPGQLPCRHFMDVMHSNYRIAYYGNGISFFENA